MATLYRRGRTWWCAYSVGGRRVQRSLKTGDRRLAQEAVKVIEGDAVRGRLGIPVKGATLEGVVAAYLHEQRSRSSSPWLSALRARLAAFSMDTRLRRMDQLTPMAIEEWLRLRREDYGAERAHRDHAILRGFVRWSVRMGYLQANPFDRVSPPPPKVRKPIRFLGRAEAEALLDACNAPVVGGNGAQGHRSVPLREMACVAIYSGLRLGEILALRWEDMDLDANGGKGVIHVRMRADFTPKDREERRVPMHPILRAVSVGFRPAGDRPGDLIFHTRNGTPYSNYNMVRTIKKAALRAGLSGVTWNTLRHTFASWLAMEGVSLLKIARLLGHSTTRVTEMHYAGLVPDRLHEDVEKL